jgi:hypothetical protein
MKKRSNREHVIAVRVTEAMYQELKQISESYDLPISMYCYLAVLKTLSFNNEILGNSKEGQFANDFIP